MRIIAAVVLAIALLFVTDAGADPCYRKRTCSYQPCDIYVPSVTKRCQPWLSAGWNATYLGYGCNSLSHPGDAGAQGCYQSWGYLYNSNGSCEFVADAQLQGPGCCTIACRPGDNQCWPE